MLPPVALDFETADDRGASTEYFREDFRVISVALTVRRDGAFLSLYYDTPEMIYKALKRLSDTQRPVIVHNLQFEMGVMTAKYPDLSLNWQYDTMRMCFLRDGEGTTDTYKHYRKGLGAFLDIAPPKPGVGLEKCARRYLPAEHHNHKAEAHSWLEQHHQITKKHGKYLNLLPPDILKQYNCADTEVTYLLYEDCIRFFQCIDFNDRVDWLLYTNKTRLFNESFLHGFPIDREGLLQYITETDKVIQDTDREFLDWCGASLIEDFEDYCICRDIQNKVKLEKNWPKAYLSRKESGKFKFNPGSGKQFADFMMIYKGIEPAKFTEKGAPSTAAKDMWQWEEGGAIIAKKGKLGIKLSQAINIYLASEFDGRWHPDVKGTPTATNRVRGGSEYG